VTASVPPVRRPAISRFPVSRHPYARPPRGRLPRWARALLAIALALVLLAGAAGLIHRGTQPRSLATSTLRGPRLVTGPICIEEAVDISGSLTAYAAQRDHAEHEMFTFARRHLRRDDLFSEAFFALTSQLALAPTPLTRLSAAPAQPSGISPDGTYLTPAVRALIAARATAPGGGRCAARALVIITDGLIGDPGPLAAALRQGRYTRIFAVIPSATGWGRPPELTGGTRDAIAVDHFTSPGLGGQAAAFLAGARPLDVILGTIIGSLTGQQLARA
jgi:hypothetical protein